MRPAVRGDQSIGVAAGVRIANVWLLTDDEGRRFLVDTGHRIERRQLARSLLAAGVSRPGDLEAVLLTHRHSDHAGNAAWVRERYRCPVVCHSGDAEALEGSRDPARLSGRGATVLHEALCRLEDRFPARTAVDEVYQDGAWRWGFDVIPVAGHTEGSVLLFHRSTGTLFTGDAVLAGMPAQRLHVYLRLAVAEYSVDAPRCHRAVLAFLRTQPGVRTLCSGHGPALRRGLQARLNRLVNKSEA